MVGALYRNEQPGQLPDSWYVATAEMPPMRHALKGAHRADVCVVGAGFTGLSAARHLAAKGLSVIVLDAHRVGFGASGRNGGQVWSGYNQPMRALAKRYGAATARALWDLTEEAKDDVRKICAAEVPEARFRPGIAEAATRPAELDDMHRNAEFLQTEFGYDRITLLDRDALRAIVKTDDYYGGHLDTGAGHMHPMRYLLALARLATNAGAEIFEGSEVLHITHGDPAVVQTAHGQVTAGHVVLAGNGYLTNLAPRWSAKVMPINSYIAATEPLGDRADSIMTQDIAVSDSKHVLNYYRLSEDRRLLFGGRASYSLTFGNDVAAFMAERIAALFPQIAGVGIDYAWGGTLGITPNKLPVIMRVGSNVLAAGGYSGVGVALSGLAGKVMAEAVAGQAGRFETLSAFEVPSYPGGTLLRSPIRRLGMAWFQLRDKLGV